MIASSFRPRLRLKHQPSHKPAEGERRRLTKVLVRFPPPNLDLSSGTLSGSFFHRRMIPMAGRVQNRPKATLHHHAERSVMGGQDLPQTLMACLGSATGTATLDESTSSSTRTGPSGKRRGLLGWFRWIPPDGFQRGLVDIRSHMSWFGLFAE